MEKHRKEVELKGQFDSIVEQINTMNNVTKRAAKIFVKAHPLIGKAFSKMGRSYGDVIKKCNIFSQHVKGIVFKGESFLEDFSVYLEDPDDFSADDLKECMVDFQNYAKIISSLKEKSQSLTESFVTFNKEVNDLKKNINEQKKILEKELLKEHELRIKESKLKLEWEQAKENSKKQGGGFFGAITGFFKSAVSGIVKKVVNVGGNLVKKFSNTLISKIPGVGEFFSKSINGVVDKGLLKIHNKVDELMGTTTALGKSYNNFEKHEKEVENKIEKMVDQASKCAEALNNFEKSIEEIQKVLANFLKFGEIGDTLREKGKKVEKKAERMKIAIKFLKNTQTRLEQVVKMLKEDGEKFDKAVENSWKVLYW